MAKCQSSSRFEMKRPRPPPPPPPPASGTLTPPVAIPSFKQQRVPALPPPGARPLEDVSSDYEKKSHLGEGQYGVVWEAIRRSTGEQVALKQVQIRDPNEGYPLTCIREVAVLKKLQNNDNDGENRGLVKLKDLVVKYQGRSGAERRVFASR